MTPARPSVARGEVLASRLYAGSIDFARQTNAGLKSDHRVEMAEWALDSAAIFMRALSQRDPVTCERRNAGLPVDEAEVSR